MQVYEYQEVRLIAGPSWSLATTWVFCFLQTAKKQLVYLIGLSVDCFLRGRII